MNARLAFILPLAGYAIYLAESVFARPNPMWAFLLLLWAMGAAVAAWNLAQGSAKQLLAILERNSTQIALGIIISTTVGLIAISVLQARYFALGAYVEDTAYYNQILWNTLHGDFLAGNLQQARIYNPPVSNDLALHVSPVLLVGILPIYAIFPHFLTLLIIRDIAIAAAAWPLFLLGRERLGGIAGVAAVILYFANPAVIAQATAGFYLLQLAPLPFFWALRAFVREDFRTFVIWTGIAIGLREDVAITMAGFGLWALLKRRPPRWWLVGLGIPVIWWVLSTTVIQPAFGRGRNSGWDIALAGGSHSQSGVYKVLLGKPSWILEALSAGGLEYLYRLLRSVGFLSVLGGEWLLSFPTLLANLFLGRVTESGSDPTSRFALLPSCALIGAAVVIVGRLGRKYHWDRGIYALAMLLLLPSASLLDGAKDTILKPPIQTYLGSYAVDNEIAMLREAIKYIPDTASVAAPHYALPALSSRRGLFFVTHLDQYPHATPDYILFDHNLDRINRNPGRRERYTALLNTFSHSDEYDTIWQQGEFLLLGRKKGL